jgi:hypothetical protein
VTAAIYITRPYVEGGKGNAYSRMLAEACHCGLGGCRGVEPILELQEAWARVAVGFEQLADQGDRLRENALMRSTKPINHRP